MPQFSTRSIPNLGFLEFLAFGKAVRAERPILLKRPFDQAKMDVSEKLRQCGCRGHRPAMG